MHKIDDIDLIVLEALQKNGRMSNVDLAEKAGISAPPCLRRLRTLEDMDIIKGYTARLNGPALGYTITVFIKVALASTTDTDLKAFIEKINSWPEVREAWALAGDSDFMMKVVARDWDDYQRFLLEVLPTAPSIGTNKSYLTVKTIKDEGGIPL